MRLKLKTGGQSEPTPARYHVEPHGGRNVLGILSVETEAPSSFASEIGESNTKASQDRGPVVACILFSRPKQILNCWSTRDFSLVPLLSLHRVVRLVFFFVLWGFWQPPISSDQDRPSITEMRDQDQHRGPFVRRASHPVSTNAFVIPHIRVAHMDPLAVQRSSRLVSVHMALSTDMPRGSGLRSLLCLSLSRLSALYKRADQ